MKEEDLIKIIENYDESGKEDTYGRCGLFSGAMEDIKKNIIESEDIKNIFNFAKKVNLYKLSIKNGKKFDENSREGVIDSLLENIYYHFFSIYHLASYGLRSECEILNRTIMENYLHFKKSIQDESYYLEYVMSSGKQILNLQSADQKEKMMEEELEKQVSLLLSFFNSKDNKLKTKGISKKIKEIEKHELKKGRASFDADSFIRLYQQFSSTVHADLSILSRFTYGNGKKIGITVNVNGALFMSAFFLFTSINEYKDFFKLETEKTLKNEVIKSLAGALRNLKLSKEHMDQILKTQN